MQGVVAKQKRGREHAVELLALKERKLGGEGGGLGAASAAAAGCEGGVRGTLGTGRVNQNNKGLAVASDSLSGHASNQATQAAGNTRRAAQ